MRALQVAILGAGGTIGPAIVRDLAESDEAADLLLLDLDESRAREVARVHGAATGHAEKIRAAGLDARGGGLEGALEGRDVLVNAAGYRVNVEVMHACLSAGCHYMDLGGLYRVTGHQLELDGAFREAGLLALLGIGSSPGKTNVMALQAVRELEATPERIDVIAAGRDLSPPDGPSYPYSPRTLVDEVTLPPVAVRDGQAVELEPLGDGGIVELPEPFGRCETIYTLHSEMRTFAQSFGCRQASFRLSLAPAVLERVRGLAAAPDEEIEAAARDAVPASPHTVSAHVIEVGAGGRVVTITAITRPMEEWALGGGVVSTAAPAAASVRLLARGRIDARGALPPERCIEPGDLFPELERRNCSFDIHVAATPRSGTTGDEGRVGAIR